MRHVPAGAALRCLIAGFVDAIGYTELGAVFAANMTSNSVPLAIAAAHGDGSRVMADGFTSLLFCGAFSASALRRARDSQPFQ